MDYQRFESLMKVKFKLKSYSHNCSINGERSILEKTIKYISNTFSEEPNYDMYLEKYIELHNNAIG